MASLYDVGSTLPLGRRKCKICNRRLNERLLIPGNALNHEMRMDTACMLVIVDVG